MTSRSSSDEVRMTTGRSRVPSSARMRCSTSIPLTLGSLRSSSTTAGSSFSAGPLPSAPNRMSSACAPSCATTTSLVMLWLLSARSVNATSSGLSSTSRIFPGFTRASRPAGSGPSQSEVERRSLIDGAFGPDPAAVPVDDAPDGGQTDAGALEVSSGMQSLEYPEQLIRILHVEAGAVVPDHEGPAAVRFDRGELDPRLRLLRGVLPAVPQQIVEGHAQQPCVASRPEPRGDREFHLSFRGRPLQIGHDVVRYAAQVHVLGPYLRTGDPGELQQVVDQRAHPLAGGAHPVQRLLSRLVQLPGIVFEQYLAESVDTAQRCPQVVRYRVGECVELGVGGEQLGRVAPQRLVALLELMGPLLHTLLELGGVALQLVLLVLDAAEHLVEGIGQRTQLVRAELGGPHGVILSRGNGFGGLRERQNGLRDRTLQDPGQEVRRQ